MSKHFPKNI